jgi:hypothetical protein
MEKISCYKYCIIFLLYCIVIFYFNKNNTLTFEWKVIIEDFATYHDYYYLGKPSAYMPPLYPYYLLLIQSIFKVSQWIMISCILQSVLLFFSVRLLVQTFEENDIHQSSYFLAFVCIIFFPPILFGTTRISSFSLTISVVSIFFALIIKLLKKFTTKNSIFISIVSIFGLYIRFEFLFLMIISVIVFILYKKLKYYSLIFLFAFILLAYFPWCMRNKEKIGIFHYSTSLNYNFAKGNHEKYDILSSANLPYDPLKKIFLTDEYLRHHYTTEKEMDHYLGQLNKNFISEHPQFFIKNNLEKIGINFLNFYPNNYNFSNDIFKYLYCLILSVFNLFFIYAVIQKIRYNFAFDATLLGALFIFYLLFYSIAPLPRYYLLYFPLFFLFTFQYFNVEIQLILSKIKNILNIKN